MVSIKHCLISFASMASQVRGIEQLKEAMFWIIFLLTLLTIYVCAYLQQFLGNLRNLRDSHAALAFGSSETSDGPSSVTRIISECESALTVLNRDLGILSASIAREQGEKMNIWWNMINKLLIIILLNFVNLCIMFILLTWDVLIWSKHSC